MRGFMDVGDKDREKILTDQAAEIAEKPAPLKGRKKAAASEPFGKAAYENVVGTILGGRYEIRELLGKGGMAYVYLAHDNQDDMDVAVKILKDELTTDEEFIRRFDTEAKAASSLSYPNIVKVYGVGQEGRLRYMVLEYVNGISLKELIEKNGHLEWEVALPIAIQIGLALDNAHKNGIVHRDIKPHNIIVTSELIAKVTDFGIARAASANTVTLTGKNTMGSVHYSSPEQARGGIVGAQSDIYSLGVLLYEMLTGTVPFDGDTTVSIALKHIQQNPVPPKEINPDIPEGLNNIVMKCLQKSTDLRYKTAKELVGEMDAFMVDPNGVYGFINKSEDKSKTSVIKPIDKESNFNKLRELEMSINQRRKNKLKERLLVFTVILVTLGVLAYGGYYGYQWLKAQFTPEEADYTVENYVGSKIEDVENKLTVAKIKYSVSYEQNDTVDAGIVFYQSVAEGLSMRPEGASSITLKVSSGKDTVRLGDYKGKNFKLVESELTQQMTLKVTIVREMSGEYEKDTVIGTNPGAGNDVAKGGEVTLIVSDGLMNVTVPNVVGKSRAEALALLEKNYLAQDIFETLLGADPNLPEEQQYVLGIEPAAGTEVKAKTKVSLLLGSYDDYLNTVLPVVTPMPGNSSETSSGTGGGSGVSAP